MFAETHLSIFYTERYHAPTPTIHHMIESISYSILKGLGIIEV
jgi:hypothetical protein